MCRNGKQLPEEYGRLTEDVIVGVFFFFGGGNLETFSSSSLINVLASVQTDESVACPGSTCHPDQKCVTSLSALRFSRLVTLTDELDSPSSTLLPSSYSCINPFFNVKQMRWVLQLMNCPVALVIKRWRLRCYASSTTHVRCLPLQQSK